DSAFTQRVVSAGAYEQVARTTRKRLELFGDIFSDVAIDSQERCLPFGRKPPANLLDHRRTIRHIASVVKNRVAEQNHMSHRQLPMWLCPGWISVLWLDIEHLNPFGGHVRACRPRAIRRADTSALSGLANRCVGLKNLNRLG